MVWLMVEVDNKQTSIAEDHIHQLKFVGRKALRSWINLRHKS
jgi:hypothetical protein